MNEPPPQWIYILLLIILLFLSMIFSSGETAYLSVNKLKIKYLREKKNKQARYVEKILNHKQDFLTTSLIGNSIVNILISVLLTSVMIELFGKNGLTIAVPIATVAILIFGEILPKSIALVFPESIALKFSSFITALMFLAYPIVQIISAFTNFILSLLKIKTDESEQVLTDADLKDFFDSSEERGTLRTEEHDVLEKILHYGDTSVKNIMTPRVNIIAIKTETSIDEIIELSHQSRFSRFPVYEKDIDEICGIFYIKDCLFAEEYSFLNNTKPNELDVNSENKNSQLSEYKKNFDLKDYLRKPVFVFENTPLSKLQEIFKNEKQNMLIVIDEYGGTLGLATLEDLNEEIFGNLADEYDADDTIYDDINIDKNNSSEIENNIISGNVQLQELNEELGTTFSSEYYDTIGGLIMEKRGDVPEEGFEIKIENYIFKVVKIDKNKIEELSIIACGEDE